MAMLWITQCCEWHCYGSPNGHQKAFAAICSPLQFLKMLFTHNLVKTRSGLVEEQAHQKAIVLGEVAVD